MGHKIIHEYVCRMEDLTDIITTITLAFYFDHLLLLFLSRLFFFFFFLFFLFFFLSNLFLSLSLVSWWNKTLTSFSISYIYTLYLFQSEDDAAAAAAASEDKTTTSTDAAIPLSPRSLSPSPGNFISSFSFSCLLISVYVSKGVAFPSGCRIYSHRSDSCSGEKGPVTWTHKKLYSCYLPFCETCITSCENIIIWYI